MRAQHVGKNLLLISTYMLLLKDSLVLYPILNDGVIGLIGSLRSTSLRFRFVAFSLPAPYSFLQIAASR